MYQAKDSLTKMAGGGIGAQIVFDSIFENYELINVQQSNVIGSAKIYQQKMNNKLGIMCFILADYGLISNVNIFDNFND